MTVRLPVRVWLLCIVCLLPAQRTNAVSPEALSGNYQLHFEQTAKDCGPRIDPIEAKVSLQSANGKLRVRFPIGFLGVTVLETDYDGSRDEIIREFSRRVDLGETKATLKLTLRARIQHRAGRPQIVFNIVFDKAADNPDWNCRVVGRGWATKI